MICFIDKTTDPYYNLATEEYLLKEYDKPVFRLWQNSSAVIVGRYQNAIAEINHEFTRSNNIPVIRRLSGGGAVFHDLGNINFTFIDKKIQGEDTSMMFKRFTAPILDALHNLGIKAYLEGRNDLLIDGAKFSGNAIAVHKDRVLQHGTLLFSSSMADLSNALNTRPEKFLDKSVKSNISRVTNISSHLPKEHSNMNAEMFMSYLRDFFINGNNELCEYSDKDISMCEELKISKYMKDSWNFGESPKYEFSNSIKLPCGFIESNLNVKSGIIQNCIIQGDYFFLKPTEEIESALIGIKHNLPEITQALSSFNLVEYFGKDINLEILSKLLS